METAKWDWRVKGEVKKISGKVPDRIMKLWRWRGLRERREVQPKKVIGGKRPEAVSRVYLVAQKRNR